MRCESALKIKKFSISAATHFGCVTSVRAKLVDRFWWPSLGQDVKYFVKTCHACQTRQTTQIVIPLSISQVPTLFQRIHIDTKTMPRAGGFRYIVYARCALSQYPEFRLLRNETGRAIGQFIFEDLLCRYGVCPEIVTNNGKPFVAALDYLKDRFGIQHIRISGYNSQANGLVERKHFDVQEALMKAADGKENKWHEAAYSVFWAERITVHKSTGMSPSYIAHGVEPVLPFDLDEATYLAPPMDTPLSTVELIATRARQLQKRAQDLDRIAKQIKEARESYARHFEEVNRARIRNYDFEAGRLVLLRNSKTKMELNRKTKPRYLGPYVVTRRTKGGSYEIAELDGSKAKAKIAAFRLIPYFARNKLSIPVARLIADETGDEFDPDLPSQNHADDLAEGDVSE